MPQVLHNYVKVNDPNKTGDYMKPVRQFPVFFKEALKSSKMVQVSVLIMIYNGRK